jgi:hypothetical protein
MAKEKSVKIYHLIILDNSASMASVTMQTIEGVNTQLKTIKADADEFKDQEHIFCLVTFGDKIKYDVWKQAANTIEELTNKTYIANGWSTAMCDAIGGGINGLRNEIVEELKNEDTKVFVNIFTDGYENSSKEFDAKDCKELIEEVQQTGQWVVAMVGCEENVFEEAAKMGIHQGNTVKYARGAVGTQVAMQHLSRARHKMSDDVSKGLYSSDTTTSYMADTVVPTATNVDPLNPNNMLITANDGHENINDINMNIDAGDLINKAADVEDENNE